VNEFARAMRRIMDGLEQFKRTLAPRDFLMLQMGMRASHIEEALSQGDTDRARFHLEHLLALIQRLPADATGFTGWRSGHVQRGYRGPIHRSYLGPWVRRWTWLHMPPMGIRLP